MIREANISLKILFIDPVVEQNNKFLEEAIKSMVRPDVSVDIACVKGPTFVTHLRYFYYTQMIMVPMLEQIIDAEKKGYDAVIIGCFADPGVKEAREVVRIPVIGPCSASLYVASIVSNRFSIITSGGKAVQRIKDLVRMYGFEHFLASIRDLGMKAPEILNNFIVAKQKALEMAKKSLHEDKAEAIVLGCTGEAGMSQFIQEKLGVPVVDPVVSALKIAEIMAELHKKARLSNSTIGTYEPPPELRELRGLRSN
jgi:allantoin racemase